MNTRWICTLGAALLLAAALLFPTAALARYSVWLTNTDGTVVARQIEPFVLPGTAVEFYSYGDPNAASANTGLEQSETLTLALLQQSDGTIALLAIFDGIDDGTGGRAQISVSVSPWQTGLTFLVKDDPGESAYPVDPVAGTASAQFTWAPCCTDGFVFGALSGHDWTMHFNLTGVNTLTGINYFRVVSPNPDGSTDEFEIPANLANDIVFLANSPPTAVIDPHPALHTGDEVMLNGSHSTDPEGDALTYHWTLTPPPGSLATLSDDAAVMPTFTPDIDGDYLVQLVVNDGLEDSDPVQVTLNSANAAPVANAGADQWIDLVNTVVQLDGSESFDPDDDPLTYQWSIVSRPAGSAATLDDATAVNPSFTADVNGTYTLQLVVTDHLGPANTPALSSEPDTVVISFNNVVPVANPGEDQAVVVGSAVTLAGSGSDANGDPLTYSWSLLSVPAGSAAVLTDADMATAGFTADLPGTYVAQLIVNDGIVDSVPATVTIEAITRQDAAAQTLLELIAYIRGLPPTDADGDAIFKHRHLRKALLHKLFEALRMVQHGKYRSALLKLQRDVAPKLDGCNLRGAADRHDWIQTCEEQDQAYGLLQEAIGYLRDLAAGRPHRHRDHRWHRHHHWPKHHWGRHDGDRHDVGFGGGWDDHGKEAKPKSKKR